MLDELTKPENFELAAEFTTRRFSKNSSVYPPEFASDIVFIVKKGRLRLYLAVEDKDFSLAILESGDIFVTHTRAHIEALDDVELLVMPTGKLHHYMTSHPQLSTTVISILGQILSQSFSIIDSLVFKDIKQRLTDFFLYEASHNGIIDQRGIIFQLDLTITQLAAIVGAYRQTVSTIISAMLKDGVLQKKQDNMYCIPNIDLFRNYAQS